MKTDNIIKSIPPCSWTYGEITPLFIKWMTSQAYNNNDAALFSLQIWKQPHQIKCFDQFRVNKWDTDYVEDQHEENTKLSVNKNVSDAWIFLPTSGFFMVFTDRKGGEEWRNSNRIGRWCWSPCVVKLRPSEAVIQGIYENNMHLSKLNSFAYNLFDLEISFFSTMESYIDLDLHLQFVCFFRNERLYIDRPND